MHDSMRAGESGRMHQGGITISISRTLLFSAVAQLFVAGCESVETRRYEPNPPNRNDQTLPLRVAVVELDDWNKGENYNGFVSASYMLIMPLIPWTEEMDHYNPTKFGRCLATELDASRMFEAVQYYADWEELSHKYKDYDLLLTGKLRKDRTQGNLSFYALGPIGLIIAGITQLPTHFMSREVDFEVRALAPFTPMEDVLFRQIHFEDSESTAHRSGQSGDLGQMWKLSTFQQSPSTDFCTAKFLQPKFLELRNDLKKALEGRVLKKQAKNAPN